MPDERPLVSCIMPTRQRRAFVPAAIRHFLEQDYAERELLVIDDGPDSVRDLIPADEPRIRYVQLERRRTIGAKRNLACDLARGTLIAHWDDDDWMAPWRLSYQVDRLVAAGADACGLDRLLYVDLKSGAAWRYQYPSGQRPWLVGGTLVYRRAFWVRNHFPDRDVGEDTAFVWARSDAKYLVLDDERFYVGRMHPSNTAPKRTGDGRWHKIDAGIITAVMGAEAPELGTEPAPAAAAQSTQAPHVSCVMPTKNRAEFARRAAEYFLAQNYPGPSELIVVEDGPNSCEKLLPRDPRIGVLRSPLHSSIGEKRNLGTKHARGPIVVQWDDDDWSGPNRLTAQVTPIENNQADIVGFTHSVFIDLPTATCWTCTPALHARMFAADVHGRSIAFRRSLWENGLRYPNRSNGEDAELLRAAQSRVQLERVPGEGLFAYVRHTSNQWRFRCGDLISPTDWKRIPFPGWLPAADREFYERLAGREFK